MSNGTENGGIMGYNTGLDDSNSHVFVFNCYNTGGFSDSSGGICATSDSNGERVIILNCYSTCGIEDLDNTSYSFGGIVAASNTTFQPYVIYCDVYITNTNASFSSSYNKNKLISRNDYRSIGISDESNEIINSISTPYEEKYHTLNFNLISLKNLISTLPYDFISPVWETDNLSIPSSNFESNMN